jgi:hypothetical protein
MSIFSLRCISIFAFCFLYASNGSASLLPLPTDDASVPLPSHDAVCDGGIVSKKRLSKYIIGLTDNGASKTAGDLIYGDPVLWRSIFFTTPEQFCPTKAFCPKGVDKKCQDQIDACKSASNQAIVNARALFKQLTKETAKAQPVYKEAASLSNEDADKQAAIYFSSPANIDARIVCTATDIPSPPPPETSKFRVRGISDDLYIDRSDEKAFKATSQATLTSTGDRSTTPTQTLKTKGAIGYAFEGDTIAAIPYFSFYQSVTDTFGKPQSTDPTSNVAAGMLFNSRFSTGQINNVINAKPQFFVNTKDHSEIGSLRLSYTPYTSFLDSPNLNLFQQLPFFPMLSAQVQFDLRLDAGTYANRGNDPVQSLLNKDYVRSGTRVGLAFTTDPNLPSFTLVLAQTYLYGLSGSVRNLSISEASLTYNFNKYVGLTGSYRNGIDEDTAIRVETWMVGLSGRF